MGTTSQPVRRATLTRAAALAVALLGALAPAAHAVVPRPTAPPSLTLSPDGVVLTVDPGTWDGAPTFAYRWQVCNAADAATCHDVTGATDTHGILPSLESGHWIVAFVQGANAEGSAEAASDFHYVPYGVPYNRRREPPAVVGDPYPDAALTATPGGWENTPPIPDATYRWQAGPAVDGPWTDVPASAADGALLRPGAAGPGTWVRVVVAVSNPDQPTRVEAASAAVQIVARPPVAPSAAAAPSISGAAVRVGAALTGHANAWTGTQPIGLSDWWQRCPTAAEAGCTAIPGATSAAYVIAASDVGYRLRYGVMAVNAAGARAAFSAMTDVVAAALPALRLSVRGPVHATPLPTVRRSGIPVRVRCSRACTVDGRLLLDARTAKRLRLGRRTAGTVHRALPAGSGRLVVRLDPLVARRLAASRRGAVTLTLRLSVLDGIGATTVRTVHLRVRV